MNATQAEQVLAALPTEELRKVVSRLAGLTPKVVYFDESFSKSLMDISVETDTRDENGKPTKMSLLGQALMFVACVAPSQVEPGEQMRAEFTALHHRGEVIGDFVVTVERL